MNILTRTTAKQATYFKRKKVDVTELGNIPTGQTEPEPTFVYVTEVAAQIRDEIEDHFVSYSKKGRAKISLTNVRAIVATYCCVNENGDRIFEYEDADWLSTKSAAALSRIYDAYNELNGISEEDQEELEKNFEKKPTTRFGSNSPSGSTSQASDG